MVKHTTGAPEGNHGSSTTGMSDILTHLGFGYAERKPGQEDGVTEKGNLYQPVYEAKTQCMYTGQELPDQG